MIQRLSVILALLLLPAGALADDATPTPEATPAMTSDLQPGTGTAQTGGSNDDSSNLQPAAGSGLGSSTGDSSGLTAPTGNTLQGATNANDQARQLLAGEADGAPRQPDDLAAGGNPWLEATLVWLVLVAAGGLWWLRRRQLAAARLRFVPADTLER